MPASRNIDSVVARYAGGTMAASGALSDTPGLKGKLGELASQLAAVQNEVLVSNYPSFDQHTSIAIASEGSVRLSLAGSRDEWPLRINLDTPTRLEKSIKHHPPIRERTIPTPRHLHAHHLYPPMALTP